VPAFRSVMATGGPLLWRAPRVRYSSAKRNGAGPCGNPAYQLPTCLNLVGSSVVSRAAKLLGHRLYRDRSATSCRP
jgi:hypothetical protein